MSDEGKIIIVDHFGTSSKKIEVGFSRTLRVPEDGILYNPPVLLSPFPLINSEELALDRLSLRRKGGLLIPLWQREAIYAGSVNAVSGATHKRSAEDDAQDYVLAPLQNRLDGFLVRAGVVKQFVTMPLGSGYTAEGQITGQEVFGGLQILIAPRFRARGTFKGHDNQRMTPRELGLKVDDRLFMSGDAVTTRAREFGYGNISEYFTEDGCMFHHSKEGRPLFVHEMAVHFPGMGNLSKPHEPRIVVKPKKELRWDMGLAPGGEIKQAVVPDKEPLEWNWTRARLVNVQIINSVIFENLTGIAPPLPPISFKDYLKAKLPFFDLLGDASLQGGKVLGKLRSVGKQD
ncbi:hypothetical protein DL98DRAFT_405404, partial [Cadophora sp. DSE1049]